MSNIKNKMITLLVLFCLFIPCLSTLVSAEPEDPAPGDGTGTNEETPEEEPVYVASSVKSLTSITINGKEIEDFTEDKLEYKVTLSSDITWVEIDATKKDRKSKISGTGNFEVTLGESYTYDIIVTAENRSKRTYKINVVIDIKPTVFIPFNEKSLGFEVVFDDLVLPQKFEETKITYQEKELKAWKNTKEGKQLTIVYLSDEEGNKDFYVFKENKITSIYKQLVLADSVFDYYGIPEDVAPEATADFIYQESLVVKGATVSGWTFVDENNKDFVLLYLTNELEETDFYVYGLKNNKVMTLSAFNLVQKKTKSKISIPFIVAVIVIVIVSLTFLLSILRIHRRKNKRIKNILKNVDKEVFDDLPITYTRRKG